MSHPVVFRPLQARFLSIPQAPLCYWLRERFFELLAGKAMAEVAVTRAGLTTGDSPRFYRYAWELAKGHKYILLANGGTYKKWAGCESEFLRFDDALRTILKELGNKLPSEDWYRRPGASCTQTARGCLSFREMRDSAFTNSSIGLFPVEAGRLQGALAALNSRVHSYLVRSITPKMGVEARHIDPLPAPPDGSVCAPIAGVCVRLKRHLVALDPTERSFSGIPVSGGSLTDSWRNLTSEAEAVAAVLHTVEGLSEREVFKAYGVAGEDLQAVLDETGTPAGWFPLIAGYDAFPTLPPGLAVPAEVLAPLAHEKRRSVSTEELDALKRRLRALYEAGPGAKVDEEEEPGSANGEDSDENETAVLGARIPIPAETFLEELAQKLEVHPISVYWLLRELRDKDGVVCQPELQRFVEDYVSVTVLRLLGHRWPKQIEAGELLPAWADRDGIIPLTEGTGEPTLLERVRERIAEDFGPDRVNAIEQEFERIIGKPLGTWLSTAFFARHVSQFKKRPIAWQIESSRNNAKRGRRGKANAPAAFSCLVYYHRLDADLLPKLRSQYVGPLRTRFETELAGLERLDTRTADQDERRVQLERLIEELKDFDARLEQVITTGFSSPTLDAVAKKEPLDRWTSRDEGTSPPATREAFLAQERKYDPDLNDGVRVNIAPLQLARLLAADVLAAKDVEKAIADRAQWRADERRWCREGKLPQPGWWPSKEAAQSAPKNRIEARR